ncbi:hypothetical protein VTJ83DRAFT_1205 [Remersonia thermophila]|uniref:Kri1-like C-terminal domain-containing protein n=1 Tax=Remersonia thermophila TaxID=72144 RepID=A0ABR4DNZ3_9PEZI
MAFVKAKSAKGAPQGDQAPPKKKLLFDDSESESDSGSGSGSSSDDDQEDGGATLGNEPQLKINEEYARRFEHNKKREELHRLQEKYKNANQDDLESESSSESETEDDDAVLITEDLDAEISATLQAIRNRDPRIYDKNAVFYKPFDPDAVPTRKEEKPMTLRDYHRERYMRGDVGADDDDAAAAAAAPRTYAQEQEDIKKSIISEINAAAAAAADDDDEDWSDDDAFIKPAKREEAKLDENGVHPSRAANITLTEEDVANADKNPEEFLAKFMASKAWAPAEGPASKWQAFESDEGEDDAHDLADEFEHAYNMRFEDPNKSNEFLKTYSRTLAAARSVRKEELSGRKKQRALEKERKEAEKKEREQERARLRRLKIEEASEKLAKIKQAAGLRGTRLKDDEWLKLLDEAWDNDKWEEEMRKRFGDDYYAEPDDMSLDGDEDESDEGGEDGKKKKKKKKIKKPKWDDDIDIKDIVPDFEEKPAITLSDDNNDGDNDNDAASSSGSDDDEGEPPAKKRKTAKDLKKERIAAKRQARADLAKIEALVDTKLELENPRALQKYGKSADGKLGGFRYRETSPNSFGLTARDILLAPSDAALNEFAGLKKLATFRDEEKKRRDKKRLGKKARLRKWRREVFGREFEQTGPTFGFEKLIGAEEGQDKGHHDKGSSKKHHKDDDKPRRPAEGESGIVEGERKKKRKRSKGKNKGKKEGEEVQA